MIKKIISMLLCGIMVCGMCACGGDTDRSSGANESATDSSASSSENSEADTDNTSSTDDVSDAVSEDDVSTDDTSGGEYVDQEGYELFLEASKTDKVLEERGFKDKGANSDYVPLNYDKMKAVWISQFDFNSVYCSNNAQRMKAQFKKYVEKAYDNLVSLGFNTVIVQVRPNADSFYPSAYYPWSHYVVGSYGNSAKYDPLEIMIELAHEKNLSFQAWINPMRGMSTANINKIDDAYTIKSWKSKMKYKTYLYEYNGLNYLNVAHEDVREHIINAAAEIVRNYDVDGVHMDDYFYWGEEPDFDITEFNAAKRKNATLTLQKFRYDNLNNLVSGIYSAIKEENKNVIFGISPAGNITQMYNKYYADVETWLSQDGYVDYIMPQIYFGMEHQTWSFPYTYQEWSKVTTNPNIKFMAGMSLGKAVSGNDPYAGTGADEWTKNKDVFKKCFEYSVKQSNYGGFAVFAYSYMFDPLTGEPNAATAEEVANCKAYFTTLIKGEVIKY